MPFLISFNEVYASACKVATNESECRLERSVVHINTGLTWQTGPQMIDLIEWPVIGRIK